MELVVWLSLVMACVVVGMTYGRFTPGSCCGCGTSCYFATDDFDRASIGSDWTVVSGTWAISSNQLAESAGGGVIVWATNADSHKMVAEANFSGISAGESARVIVAYTDADNYLYGQIAGVGSNYEVSLYKRSGGVETLLAGPSSYTSIAPVLRVCYDGSTLRLRSDQFVALQALSVTSFTGTKAGLGTGGSSAVGFDNFKGAYQYSYQAGCLGCWWCSNCKDNQAARKYSITCGTVNEGAYCSNPGSPTCSGRNVCSDYSGTYILDGGGAGSCVFTSNYYLDEWCGGGFLGLCQLRYQWWQLRFQPTKIQVLAGAQSDGRPPSATGGYVDVALATYEFDETPPDCMQTGRTLTLVSEHRSFCSFPSTLTFNGPAT